jgi:hypothetical protein
VPVVQLKQRAELSPRRRSKFFSPFQKLKFLVAHPEIRLRPRESTYLKPDKSRVLAEKVPNLLLGRQPLVAQKKSAVAWNLVARTEYTKSAVQNMLQSMEEWLSVVEKDLQIVDDNGKLTVDVRLDQKNFANLHKEYETIRAELINTLKITFTWDAIIWTPRYWPAVRSEFVHVSMNFFMPDIRQLRDCLVRNSVLDLHCR